MKTCGLESCHKPIPPSSDRTLLEIRTVPGFSWQFWKFFWGLLTSDINQEVFCSPEHLMEYLKTFQMPVSK